MHGYRETTVDRDTITSMSSAGSASLVFRGLLSFRQHFVYCLRTAS